MGLLVKGKWQDQWYDTESTGGEFVRQDSQFRNWVTADGSAGPSGEAGFAAESDRYHLFVSLACPWAHRTLIMRALKGLQDDISVTVVDPVMLGNGWEFSEVSQDNPVTGLDYLYQIYTHADPNYSGRVTVPVLWDKQQSTIVSNESSEIIRMLNSAFPSSNTTDYYPEALRADIDALNQRIYDNVNNGVYRAGFATSQNAYEKAYARLFTMLDELDQRLANQRYLFGADLSEADIRLFTTLIRFDSVYFGHFKCNRQLLEDYQQLSGYIRDIYQLPGVAETVNFEHIKTHYYVSHTTINPTQVVPVGPAIDYYSAHNREQLL